MSARATVTFHTSPETKARLERLAAATRRSKSFLSNEALERYLADEEAFILSVERGLADAAAGRVHDTASLRAGLEALRLAPIACERSGEAAPLDGEAFIAGKTRA